MVPPPCVIRKLPSGRKAMAHAPVSPVAIVSTLNGGDGFDGAGASVWPGKAGVGSGDCAASGSVQAARITAARRAVVVMARDRSTVARQAGLKARLYIAQ